MPETPFSRYASGNMAALQIAPERPSSNAPAFLLALVLLAAAAAAIFYFNPHKVAELKVTHVDPYAPHTTFGALDGPVGNGLHVLGSPTSSSEDDLYVIATVSLTDKLRLPLFISGALAHVTFDDGTVVDANLLSGADLKRLEVIFPDIRKHAISPISDGDQVNPGQTLTGTLVLPFPGQNATAWRQKKAALLTIDLRNQGPQKVTLP